MRTSLVAQLPSCPTHLAIVDEHLAVVTDEGELWLIVAGEPPKLVVRIEGDVVGLGGAHGWLHAVNELGRQTSIALADGKTTFRHIGPCRRWVIAGNRTARIVPWGGKLDPTYRADTVEVWDETTGKCLGRFESASRDCFSIDEVALSSDGSLVAWTGLDTYYTSEGDWGWGQLELLGIAQVDSGNLLVDGILGETSRPSEHEDKPVALTRNQCFAGGYLIDVPDRASQARLEFESDPLFSDVVMVTTTNQGWALLSQHSLFDDHTNRSMIHADWEGTVLAETRSDQADWLAQVRTLAATDAAVIVGLQDGRILRVEADGA